MTVSGNPPRAGVRRARAGVAAGVFAAIVAMLFGSRLGGVAWFLHLGKNWLPTVDLARRLFGPHVPVPYTKGHDGSFFWAVARDPLLLHRHATAALLDRPTYRAQRILYPVLASPWRLLGERALLWGLVITNVVVVGVGAAQTVRLARIVGAPERAAIAFALCPTVVVALIGDLGDALAVLLVVVGLRLLIEGRSLPCVVAFALAALAKESSLLVLFAALFAAPSPLRLRTRAWMAVTPSAVVGLWAVYDRWRLGWASTHFLEFAWPGTAYVKGWRYAWGQGHALNNGAIALLMWVVLIWTAVRWARERTVLRAAALAPCLLVPIFSDNVISLALNSLRALGPALTILGVDLYAAAAARRAPRPAASVSSPA